jgi:hypothetical protein
MASDSSRSPRAASRNARACAGGTVTLFVAACFAMIGEIEHCLILVG